MGGRVALSFGYRGFIGGRKGFCSFFEFRSLFVRIDIFYIYLVTYIERVFFFFGIVDVGSYKFFNNNRLSFCLCVFILGSCVIVSYFFFLSDIDGF